MSTDDTSFSSSQPLLSLREIGKRFSVGKESVRRWINNGKLQGLYIGGSIRVRVEDLDDFVKANERKRDVTAQ